MSNADGSSQGSSWKKMKEIITQSKYIVRAITKHPNYAYRYRAKINILITIWFILLFISLVSKLLISWTLRWMMDGLHEKNHETFKQGIFYFVIGTLIVTPLESLLDYTRGILKAKLTECSISILLDYYYDNNNLYYLITRQNHNIDNPSARIENDIYVWIEGALNMTAVFIINVTYFIGWTILLIYMKMYNVAYVFAITLILIFIIVSVFGSVLMNLKFSFVKLKANFRSGLYKSEEYCESIAFYDGSEYEKHANHNIMDLFINILKQMAKWYGLLTFTHVLTHNAAVIGPLLLLYPKYIAKVITLGQMFQAGEAGRQLIYSLSFIVHRLPLLAGIHASGIRVHGLIKQLKKIIKYNYKPPHIESLTTPRSLGNSVTINIDNNAISKNTAGMTLQTRPTNITNELELFEGIKYNTLNYTDKYCLKVNKLSVFVPNLNLDNHILLLYKMSFKCKYNENILITGPSGCGKSSLMRSIAGLWKIGKGTVNIINKDDIMFISQKPYLPILPKGINTLKYQLLFPNMSMNINTNEYNKILKEINLTYLKKYNINNNDINFNSDNFDWSKLLSGGEQQRLAFGRILINKPKLVFLDESTSALDDVNQHKMYKLLEKYKITYISIGHRQNLINYHQKIVNIDANGQWQVYTKQEFLQQNSLP